MQAPKRSEKFQIQNQNPRSKMKNPNGPVWTSEEGFYMTEIQNPKSKRTWHLLNCYSIHTSIRQASNEWTWMNSSSFRLSFLRRWWCNRCHRCLGNTLPGGKPQSASVSHTSISLGLRKFHETLLLLFQLHAKNDAMQPELPPRRCRGQSQSNYSPVGVKEKVQKSNNEFCGYQRDHDSND